MRMEKLFSLNHFAPGSGNMYGLSQLDSAHLIIRSSDQEITTPVKVHKHESSKEQLTERSGCQRNYGLKGREIIRMKGLPVYLRSAVIFFVLFILIAVRSTAWPQDIELSAEVDRSSVSLNEQLLLYVTVRGDINNVPEPVLPDLSDFSILSRSQSQNIEIINFQTTASISYQYILQPRKSGALVIAPVTLDYDGRTYKTAPITVVVSKSGGGFAIPAPTPSHPHIPSLPSFPSIQAPTNFPGSFPNVSFPFNDSPNISAFATVDKKTAYVNEQIILTVHFYYPAAASVERRFLPPVNKGFLTEEITPSQKRTVTHQGRRYAVEDIMFAMYPIQSGTSLTIGEVTINYQVRDFFHTQDTIKTEPLSIDVLKLPEGAPSGFSQAVGTFQLEASLDKTETPMDEPVTLTVKVTGEGNISTLEFPLQNIEGFKKFDTTETHSLAWDGSKVVGEKIFKTVLVPQKTGTISLPELPFIYFDTSGKEYRTLTTKSLSLAVSPSSQKGVTAGKPSQGAAEPLASQKSDIHYIKTELSDRIGEESPLYRNTWFLGIQIIPLLVLIGMTVNIKRQELLRRDPLGARKSKAYSTFRKNLDMARHELSRKKISEFYGALQKSLIDYVRDHYQMEGSGLTIQQIREALEDRKLPADLLDSLEAVLKASEQARFLPGTMDAKDCQEHLRKSSELVTRMEKKFS